MRKLSKSFPKINPKVLLAFIFLLALILRFLYFPQNIYFGFDQARDAFESVSIYKGDLKIIGPSAAKEGLFHGPLYWYLVGPLYLLGNGNPVWPAAFLIVLSAAGVFLVFHIGRTLFNMYTGLIAGLIYAFSFEQTQYALYFGNPAPAVLTILVFYLGFAKFLFRKDLKGIPIALLGLGLSVQFEFFLIYLGVVFLLLLTLSQRKELILFIKNPRYVTVSLLALLGSLSTFILSELKFNFRSSQVLLKMAGESAGISHLGKSFFIYADRLLLQIHDNVFSFNGQIAVLIFLFLLGAFFFKIIDRKKNILLFIWVFSSALLVFFGIPNLYYNNIGISAGFILLSSYLLYLLFLKNKFLGGMAVSVILASNLSLILTQNPKGVVSDIYVQEGMLLNRQKQTIDVIYNDAAGKPIVVSALTMPLKINTTWAYLFNWYGKEKYGYLPYWAGEAAPGYPGHLPAWQSQEKDYVMFSIIEPVRGVRGAFVNQFLEEQEKYGKVIYEKKFGDSAQTQLVLQRRR